MKLLGRDIPARELIARIEERLRTRGLPSSEEVELPPEGVEPRVEPLTFNLHALEEYADATRALPLHTHRGGVGQVVLLAKWAFRKSCQVFINETLGRQRVFNGHVRDAYAQLSAEVLRLRREVETLRAHGGAAAGETSLPGEPPSPREAGEEVAVQPPTAPAAPASAHEEDTVLPKPRGSRSPPGNAPRTRKSSAPTSARTSGAEKPQRGSSKPKKRR